MKVIAIELGYLGKLRQPGDEFEVPDGARASWFVPAVEVEPPEVEPPEVEPPEVEPPEVEPPEVEPPEVEPPEVEPRARAPKGTTRGRRTVEDLV